MQLGRAELRVEFNKEKSHIVDCTTFQALIFLVLDGKTLTFKDICERTRIPRDECEGALMSMCIPRMRLIQKAPHSGHLGDNHKFRINPKFGSRRKRVSALSGWQPGKYPPPPPPPRHGWHLIDAAIARIMKSRRTLIFNSLVVEVVKQLETRFRPTPLEIKQRVTSLITREFLRRDDMNRFSLFFFFPFNLFSIVLFSPQYFIGHFSITLHKSRKWFCGIYS